MAWATLSYLFYSFCASLRHSATTFAAISFATPRNESNQDTSFPNTFFLMLYFNNVLSCAAKFLLSVFLKYSFLNQSQYFLPITSSVAFLNSLCSVFPWYFPLYFVLIFFVLLPYLFYSRTSFLQISASIFSPSVFLKYSLTISADTALKLIAVVMFPPLSLDLDIFLISLYTLSLFAPSSLCYYYYHYDYYSIFISITISTFHFHCRIIITLIQKKKSFLLSHFTF